MGLRRMLGLESDPPGYIKHLPQITCNPLGIVEFLSDYGVPEYGGIYLYFPFPARDSDRSAAAWLEILIAKDIIRAGPWSKRVDDVAGHILSTHPHLFAGTARVEIYRIDRRSLPDLLDQLGI